MVGVAGVEEGDQGNASSGGEASSAEWSHSGDQLTEDELGAGDGELQREVPELDVEERDEEEGEDDDAIDETDEDAATDELCGAARYRRHAGDGMPRDAGPPLASRRPRRERAGAGGSVWWEATKRS